MEGAKAFALHLASELSLENLYYYISANTWKDEFDTMTDIEKLEKATNMVEMYLTSNSALEVNLSGVTKERLRAKISSRTFSADMFEASKIEVYQLMEDDSFQRFKRSPHFQAYMNNLAV